MAAAPVKTGTLRGSIHPEGPHVSASSVTAHVKTGGEASDYAIAVHEGTGPHEIRPRDAKALSWPGADHPVKVVHHPGTRPNPYLSRPLLQEGPTFLAFLRAAAERVF